MHVKKRDEKEQLTKKQIILVAIISVFIFLLVYTPHLANPYPIHIDEWRHITEAIKIRQGNMPSGMAGAESGLHVFLAFISFFIKDIVLFYKFFPAIWAVVSAVTLFFITNKLTKNFTVSVFSMLFFASIKSNVNVLGIWFFTPLTFSIPFIFLYIYLFTEGVQKQNKKMILTSLLIMIILVPTHSISFLFSVPFLIIYALTHYRYLLKEYKFFSIFLIIPLIGVLFFAYLMDKTYKQAFLTLTNLLNFKYGFGVVELNNSFFEIYSAIGYILAILGFIYIVSNKQRFKRYLAYVLWPVSVLIMIFFFRLTGFSPLSPYQRNFYYFALSLPFLSALGVFIILKYLRIKTSKIKDTETKERVYTALKIILIILVIFLAFMSYFSIPKNIKLYKTIDENNYETLIFLKTLEIPEETKIMAPAAFSTALFPITNNEAVGTIFFYGNKTAVKEFFEPKNITNDNCKTKNNLIKEHSVSYIVSEKEINCSWQMIFNITNNTVYKVY